MQKFDQKANMKDGSSFILGSGSPRRRELLREVVPEFSVIVSSVKEIETHVDGSLALVQENARLKAVSVALDYPNSWVLGADTVVCLDGNILGKPKDLEDAFSMLNMLSGQKHEVSTGLCLVHLEKDYEELKVDTSLVQFKTINKAIISEYFKSVNPLDKAGGYAIQTRADLIVESFEGSLSNVIGLPLELISRWLKNLF